MGFLDRLSLIAKSYLVSILVSLLGVAMLLLGGYVFSLYEDFRRDFTEHEIPVADRLSSANQKLADIELDLMRLIDAAGSGKVTEQEVYQQGKVLLDRMQMVKVSVLATKEASGHLRYMDYSAYLLQLDTFTKHLLTSVAMISVDLRAANEYARRNVGDIYQINRASADLVDRIHHHIGSDAEELRNSLLRVVIPMAALLCLALLVVVFLVHRLSSGINRTFLGIQYTLSRLRSGETDVLITATGQSPESRDIAASLESFRQTLVSLEYLRHSLSEQVAERTRQLSESNSHLAEQLDLLEKTSHSLRLYKKVFESITEGIVITDLDGTVIDVNQAYEVITGFASDEVVGHNPRVAKSGKHDQDFYRNMWTSIREQGSWSGEIWDKRKNGELYPTFLSISTVRDDKNNPVSYVGVFMDVSQSKEVEEQLEKMAFYDRLTGLPNRRMLLDRMDHAKARIQRSRHFGALFFLDLDHFKHINDTQGHHIGDQLLIQVAERLQKHVRASDTVGRLAGDEFVIMFEELSDDCQQAALLARNIAETLLASLAESYWIEERELHCSISIGIILFGSDTDDMGSLLVKADTAMYEAKQSGRNAYCFFDPLMQTVLQERIDMENSLRRALRNNEFFAVYQPIIDINHGVVGFEALIRWNDPVKGMVSPVEFIPVAEKSYLIRDIDSWMLRRVCLQLVEWAAVPECSTLTVSVNISGMHFAHADFVTELEAVIAATGVNPHLLKIELTETVVLNNLEECIDRMKRIQAMGIRFSMDDFGTGYSSLAYLRRLPFNQIKIDRSFVCQMMENSNDAFLVHSVITLGKLLGTEVVAEGIETEAQKDSLEALGCCLFQGYLFSRPLPVDDCEVFVRKLAAVT